MTTPWPTYDLLIVGGGQAGRRAAEGARSVAPDITVAIIGDEPHAPYDRPALSKAALETPDGITACEVRTRDSYAADRIDLLTGQRVVRIDQPGQAVWMADGHRLGYGRLILATGSRPRMLDVPAGVADRVMTLRTREDAICLSALLTPAARIVIIGGGFIGLEVASAAIARGALPIVLEAGDQLLGRVMPAAIGARVHALHRAAGVDVRLSTAVNGMAVGPDGTVLVQTALGAIEADVVVVGIGVVPNVELALDTGLAVDDGIVVDETGATDDPLIFAAGEVTRRPVAGSARSLRLESWQVAELQAEATGRTAAGVPTPHLTPPWFWSDQLGSNIQVLGHLDGTPVERTYPDGGWVLFVLDDNGALRGMAAIDSGRDISTGRRLLGLQHPMDPAALAAPLTPLRSFIVKTPHVST